MAKTANELLLDATLRHQVKLLRYSRGEAARISKLLEATDKELVAKLQTELTAYSEARLKAFLVEVRRAREQVAVAMKEQLSKDMPDFAQAEHDWEMGALNSASPVQLALAAVPASTLKAVAGSPINGVPLEGWLGQLVKSDVTKMEQAIRLGVVQGETLPQITKRVQAVADVTRRNAETIARTAVNHVSSAARQSVWEANADILDGVKWVATLDGRTSEVCASRDGMVYPVDSGPRPPAHPNCRSTITPVLKGEAIVGERPSVTDTRTRDAREVDFRADAKAKAGDAWKDMSPSERDSAVKAQRAAWTKENVGTVPGNTNYDTWLRGQSKEFQDEVLGPGKAKLFRDGMTMDKFVDEQGKPYSLAELKAELTKDSLHVVQPGVGLKAKAMLQQGYQADEVLAAVLKEFPDAKTTAASIASYKSELKKLGVPIADAKWTAVDSLAQQAAMKGQVTKTLVQQSALAADALAGFEQALPAGVKQALGGQWATLVEAIDGAPGAYGNYTAGKGVQLSVTKLAYVSPGQAQQVIAHELGHLLHKQHDVLFPDFMNDFLKHASAQLSPEGKKLYSYYLSHLDELTAEVYAQALSPSPFTSQGLMASEFKQVFSTAIEHAKGLLAEKFPVSSGLKPLAGGPSVFGEVAGKHTSIGSLAKALLQQGMPEEQVLLAIQAEFPSAKTTINSLKTYKSELKKANLLKEGSGPVVTMTKPAPIGNPPPLDGAAVSIQDVIAKLGASTTPISGSAVKDAGLKLLKAGLLDNTSVTDALLSVFPANKVNPAMVATWKSLWKKEFPAEYMAAVAKQVKLDAKLLGTGPTKVPFLHGKPLGPKSQQLLEKVKANLAAGATQESQVDLVMMSYGPTAQVQGATNLVELAAYQVETGKAAAKPYLNASYGYKPSIPAKDIKKASAGDIEKALDKIADDDSTHAEAFFDAIEGYGKNYVDPKDLMQVMTDMGMPPSDAGFAGEIYDLALAKAKGVKLKVEKMPKKGEFVDWSPSRFAATPYEAKPPPPRFSRAQHAAALKRYGEPNAADWAKKVNEKYGLSGADAVTPEEMGAIRSYTGNKTYRQMNQALREGGFSSDPALQAFVDAAQSGMRKIPPYRGLSARGVRHLPYGMTMDQFLAQYRVGAVVEEHAFTSSSKGSEAAYNGPIYFKYNGKSGRDVDWFSKFSGGEREVLFMPGTRFKITKVEKLYDRWTFYADEVD